MFGYASSSSRSEIRDYLDRLAKTLLVYTDLDSQLPASGFGFTRTAEQVEDANIRYQEPFRLAVVGEFNAGKSALINALLDRDGLLLVGVTPTTGARTELWWGDTETGAVYLESGEKLFEGTLAQAIPYTDQRTQQGRGISGKGARIVLHINSELLKNLVIIDTPGLGASARDDRATLDSLYLADAALLVVSGLQPGGEDSLSLIERLRTTGRRILVAVSRLDQVSDPADAMDAVRALTGEIADGEPIQVVAPQILRAFADLRAAEETQDSSAATTALESLATNGYNALRERLEDDFLAGEAATGRVVGTLSLATKYLTQLSSQAAKRAKEIEREADLAQERMSAAQRRIRESLAPKVPYLNAKIDEAVDVRVSELISDLSDATNLFIDKVSDGGVVVGAKTLRGKVDRRFQKKYQRQLKDEFEDLFPADNLEITENQIQRSVGSLMAAEWGGITIDLAASGTKGQFDVAAVTKQISDQLAALTAALAADLAAFLLLLFVPGGVLADLAFVFLFSGTGGLAKRGLSEKRARAKHEARVRIRKQRRKLVNDISQHFRDLNAATAERLIGQAGADASQHQARYTELMQALARWTAASDDLRSLLDSADALAGTQV